MLIRSSCCSTFGHVGYNNLIVTGVVYYFFSICILTVQISSFKFSKAFFPCPAHFKINTQISQQKFNNCQSIFILQHFLFPHLIYYTVSILQLSQHFEGLWCLQQQEKCHLIPHQSEFSLHANLERFTPSAALFWLRPFPMFFIKITQL